jgi:ubiquinol-cytochrome c reductase cytochrome b subunit
MEFLKRAWRWFDDRSGTSELIEPVLKHPVPPGTNWWYVFGSATLFAFILQVVTGTILATMYVTSTAEAYQSLQFITNEAVLGGVLRGIHYWGASAMVLFVGIHAIRVFLMGSYKFPRELNWLIGTGLLLLTVGMGFTGQLLRWDQNAIWTIVVGAEQAGRAPLVGDLLAQFLMAGNHVGGATLSRFFAVHVFLIPAVIFASLGLHLWLVLRHGISEPPEVGRPVDPATYRDWYAGLLERHGHPFWPDDGWRDAVFGGLMVIGIVILAVVFGAPKLTMPPDPSIIQANPRPDWYLLWYFGVLALIPPGLEPYVIVGAPLLVGAALISLPFIWNRGERHPLRRPWAFGAVIVIVTMVGTLWVAGSRSDWAPDFSAQPLTAEVVGTTSGPVWQGAQLFHDKGCEYCHRISGHGGRRGPDLTTVGDRLSKEQLTVRILNGGVNMPAFGGTLTPQELEYLIAFLQSRTAD